MNITFNKAEILVALAAHVAATGIAMKGKEVTLVGADDDLAVTVSIDEPAAAPRKPRGPNKPKATFKRAVKAAPEAPVAVQEAPVEAAQPDLVEQAETAAKVEQGQEEATADSVGASDVAAAPASQTKPKATPQKKRMFGAAKD